MVSCGDSFTLVLTESNEVYAFGKISHGRLGIGSVSKQANFTSENQDYIQEPLIILALKNEKVA